MEESKETGDKKKLNEDLVVFMRKRSDTETPRYTARLKTYVDFQQKRRRADDARHGNRPNHHDKAAVVMKKKIDPEHKNDHKESNVTPAFGFKTKTKLKSHCGFGGEHAVSEDSHQSRRRHPVVPEEKGIRGRSTSQTEPSDCGRRRRRRCCRRRRRSCRRRRRRRSCRRRRRRRRSCRRRRRRRSCRRRRRRRSCRRRRRRRSCRRRRRRC